MFQFATAAAAPGGAGGAFSNDLATGSDVCNLLFLADSSESEKTEAASNDASSLEKG